MLALLMAKDKKGNVLKIKEVCEAENWAKLSQEMIELSAVKGTYKVVAQTATRKEAYFPSERSFVQNIQ